MVLVIFSLLAAPLPAEALTLEPPKKNGAEPLDAIDEYVLGEMVKKHVPGLALGVYQAGSILKTEGYGWANVETKEPVRSNTVFQIQSVTKSFTASAIMLLIDEGKLGLEDRITNYITGCPESWSNITVRHLLTHTSGIKDFINEPTVRLDQDLTPEAVVASLVQRPLNFAPGEKYTYSNTGYHLLGMIIHQVSGKPWEEVLRERIFRPLAMRDTDINSATCALPRRAAGYIWADDRLQPGMYVAPTILGYAGGGILSTVNDLALWDAGLYSGKILKQSLLDQMWTPATFNNGGRSTYGFGWGVKDYRGHRVVAHTGAHATGFRSTFLRFPDDQVTVVVLINERGANPDDFGLWIAGRYIPGLRSSAPPEQSAPSPGVTQAAEPPVLPVGLDAYRQWDQWPVQRIGARAYMRGTYDRRGGNEGADASHFLYQLADDFNVTLETAGPGVLYFVRCNHWHGSPWHYEVDGVDHLVRESSTADPNRPAANSVFLPERLFPNPLTWTWSITKGADLNWVPIPFERSFRLAYSRTRYGTGYYIYHLYDRSAKLSRPIRSWDGQTPPDKAVLDLLGRAGTDIAPPGGLVRDATFEMAPGAGKTFEVAFEKPALIRALTLSAPRDQAIPLGRARLRVTWDDLKAPSIDAPLALFFGAATLYNRDEREYLVKAFPMNIRFDPERVHLACYFPMPCRRAAKIEILGADAEIADVHFTLRAGPLEVPPNHAGYFHATYRDFPQPEPGRDLVLLDTQTTEGGGDWSGSFVGTSWIFSHRAVLTTLEGDPRFFFDDSQTPQAYGTGTEEWGGGGDYWGGRNMTLPFAGHPCGARNEKEAKTEEDKIESAYRFLLADLMPFGKRAVIQLEHGGENESTEHYETVTYWYGVNRPTLVKTDELKIADAASEQAHRYVSPAASEPYEIVSRYEWGVDALRGREIYPPHTDRGRKTQGTSEFTLQLNADNYGVILRRKLDYAFPNQRAEVFVADAPAETAGSATPAIPETAWKPAGIWYLAGANTCVYSNPPEELGATRHQAQTSNRRFRDDEFIVPRELTRGRSAIRVRVKFTPVPIPLFPGYPLAELAWSEIRYEAFCYVLP